MVRCSPALAELLLVIQIQPSDNSEDAGEATRNRVTQLLVDEFANRRFGDMTVVSIHLQEVRRVFLGQTELRACLRRAPSYQRIRKCLAVVWCDSESGAFRFL